MTNEKTQFGNWVSTKLIAVPAVIGLLSAGAAAFVPALAIPAALFLAISAYFVYARYVFSPRGRDVQRRMLELLVNELPEFEAKCAVLDIGCGSGALALEIAKRISTVRVAGIDKWGTAWESSLRICERNARTVGVAERVSFQAGDAASLPFEDATFDVVVSNFVFHEVHSVRDKCELLREALRVLKPGGAFVFQDLFLWRRVYGPIDELIGALRNWGMTDVEFIDTSRSPFIPPALKLPFMVGTAGVLHGRKQTAGRVSSGADASHDTQQELEASRLPR